MKGELLVSYELFQQGAGVYIPVILISVVISYFKDWRRDMFSLGDEI